MWATAKQERALVVFKPLLACLLVEEAVVDMLLLCEMSRAKACANDARRSPFVCAQRRWLVWWRNCGFWINYRLISSAARLHESMRWARDDNTEVHTYHVRKGEMSGSVLFRGSRASEQPSGKGLNDDGASDRPCLRVGCARHLNVETRDAGVAKVSVKHAGGSEAPPQCDWSAHCTLRVTGLRSSSAV